MAENIVIIPSGGTINFYDSGSTLTTWVIETGTLKFKRGATTYFSMDNTYPNYRTTNSDLKLSVSLINNSGTLINSSGWQGSRQPTGAQGATGAQGSTGTQGTIGAQGAIGS